MRFCNILHKCVKIKLLLIKVICNLFIKKCNDLGRAAGCEMGIVRASNIATTKIFVKLGYRIEKTLDFSSLVLNGNQIIDLSNTNGTTEINYLTKLFNQ